MLKNKNKENGKWKSAEVKFSLVESCWYKMKEEGRGGVMITRARDIENGLMVV